MHVCAKCHIVSCRVLNAWRYLQAGWSEDERVERLLTQLEQCDAQLLIEFYAALRAAGQDEIVDLLREGWRMYRTAELMQLVRETVRVWLCDLRTVVEISTFLNLSDVTYRYTQKKVSFNSSDIWFGGITVLVHEDDVCHHIQNPTWITVILTSLGWP